MYKISATEKPKKSELVKALGKEFRDGMNLIEEIRDQLLRDAGLEIEEAEKENREPRVVVTVTSSAFQPLRVQKELLALFGNKVKRDLMQQYCDGMAFEMDKSKMLIFAAKTPHVLEAFKSSSASDAEKITKLLGQSEQAVMKISPEELGMAA
ncbi:MAG: hypothetical protein PHF79_01525 [Candidatus Pacebacteria bacterium]|nr:hypothetical protein [Candidatus Paceibacterota bacterium]